MIVKTRGGGDVPIRDVTVGQLLRSQQGIGAVNVTPQAVAGIPAAMRAIGIASTAVAKLKFRVWRGEGVERKPVKTTWQARFFRGVPNERESWFLLWEQTEASLTARNNAFWLKVRDSVSGTIDAVQLIHPDNVQGRWNRERNRPEYRIRIEWAQAWSDWLDSSSILHFRIGYADPATIMAPSPIDLHREALRASLSKSRYESMLYDEGVAQSLAVIFPRDVKPEEAQRYREHFQAEHGGIENRHKVRVFGGGVDVKTIGLSLQDTQYIESMQFSVEEIARIYGVDASLIGGSRLNRPISPEHEEDRWIRYGLAPRLERLEQTVRADPDFFGPGARDYPQFDTSELMRGDLETEASIMHKKVQAGIWLVDEARAKDGLLPLPDGAGQIPQVTPVGGAPNPSSSQN